MRKDLSCGKRVKELLTRRTLPTLLAGTLLFGSSAILSEAEAYSLDKPEQTYEDYLSYDGIKVFINGRVTQFSDLTGYPFVSENTVMLPLNAVAEAFGAVVNFDSEKNVISLKKYDYEIKVVTNSKEIEFIDLESGEKKINSINNNILVIDGKTYIPINGLFECFDLNVRQDELNNIIHIETVSLENLENIDFKEERIYSISDLLTMKNIKSYNYDGEHIDKDYLNVLNNSNQYAVIVKENEAMIFSYQYLSNLDYFYGKEKLLNDASRASENGYAKVTVRNGDYLTRLFFSRIFQACSFENDLGGKAFKKDSTDITDFTVSTPLYKDDMFSKIIKEANKIIEEIKSKTSDKKEQAILLTDILFKRIEYDKDNNSRNSIYGALVKYDTKCEGYAFAYNYIARELGIPCVFSSGFSKNKTSHAWNQVYINGEWVICDPTHGVKMVSLDDFRYAIYDNTDAQYLEENELIKLTYKFEN